MNEKYPSNPRQKHLELTRPDIWRHLPEVVRRECRALLGQLLLEVVQQQRSEEYERQD